MCSSDLQTVKGMSAAAQIVTAGGLILAVSECRDGFPAHGNFARLLFDSPSPRALLKTILAPGFSMFDQWEAQLLALILEKARMALHSTIPSADVRRAHMEPVADIGIFLAETIQRLGADIPIAILTEGPLTIPYLRS